MDSLSNAIQQSILTRLLANVFLFAVLIVSLGLAALELINQGSINPIITTILGTGIGIAAHAAGLNQGVTLSAIQPTQGPQTEGGTHVDTSSHS